MARALPDVSKVVFGYENDATAVFPDGVHSKHAGEATYDIYWKGRAYIEIQPKPKLNADGQEIYNDLGCWRVVVPIAQCKYLVLKAAE